MKIKQANRQTKLLLKLFLIYSFFQLGITVLIGVCDPSFARAQNSSRVIYSLSSSTRLILDLRLGPGANQTEVRAMIRDARLRRDLPITGTVFNSLDNSPSMILNGRILLPSPENRGFKLTTSLPPGVSFDTESSTSRVLYEEGHLVIRQQKISPIDPDIIETNSLIFPLREILSNLWPHHYKISEPPIKISEKSLEKPAPNFRQFSVAKVAEPKEGFAPEGDLLVSIADGVQGQNGKSEARVFGLFLFANDGRFKRIDSRFYQLSDISDFYQFAPSKNLSTGILGSQELRLAIGINSWRSSWQIWERSSDYNSQRLAISSELGEGKDRSGRAWESLRIIPLSPSDDPLFPQENPLSQLLNLDVVRAREIVSGQNLEQRLDGEVTAQSKSTGSFLCRFLSRK